MNVNVVKVIKIASTVASVLGMLGTAYATSQENKNILEKLVQEHFEK